jgi:NAD(P)-dependent dehydrogenase (short-subunit alcohol dehydrogenase family)
VESLLQHFLLAQEAIIFGCQLPIEAADTSTENYIADNSQMYITVMQGDVTSSSSVQDFVDVCIAKHGQIDIIVNKVGRNKPDDLAFFSEEVWDKYVDVNLKSVYITKPSRSTHHGRPKTRREYCQHQHQHQHQHQLCLSLSL